MADIIEHFGKVVDIQGDTLHVEIQVASACNGCHAKSLCGVSEKKDRIIEIKTSRKDFEKGETVTVVAQSSLGLKAVLLAYVIPFVLVIISLFLLQQLTSNEALSGTIALCTIIPYYIILSLFKNGLKKKFSFQVKKNI